MYKEIVKAAGELNKDPMEVFKDLLDFMVQFFTADGSDKADRTWDYSKEDTMKFKALLSVVAQEYSQGIKTHGWVDPWGECYETLLAKAKASSFGQFFTPQGLCDLMSSINIDPDKEQTNRHDCGAFGMRIIISDPTSGSGRNLLAAASKFIDKPMKNLPFFVGEDIDDLCVKMTAMNLMAHGLPGEVICHNTLTEPDTCKFGYVVNEGLFPFPGGLPTIRRFSEPNRFLTLRNRRYSTQKANNS